MHVLPPDLRDHLWVAPLCALAAVALSGLAAALHP